MQILLDPGELAAQLSVDVREGLATSPKSLPPKYFYDARGSALFEQITGLEEYYPTRAERTILAARADLIADLTRARTLIELGSGSSEKTRLLITALRRSGTLSRFVPFDVDPTVLDAAARSIEADHPGLQVAPVVGDFGRHLPALAEPGDDGPVSDRPRLVAFLGSTIGNLVPTERSAFYADLRRILGAGDALLLGVDLVKPVDRLLRAYDDAAGVTAAFDKNVLLVLNRELGAEFDPDSFEHHAVWVEDQAWIEMRLRSTRAQTVPIDALGLDVTLAAGEEIRTEISAKFSRPAVTRELRSAGFGVAHWWTDPGGDVAVLLARPV